LSGELGRELDGLLWAWKGCTDLCVLEVMFLGRCVSSSISDVASGWSTLHIENEMNIPLFRRMLSPRLNWDERLKDSEFLILARKARLVYPRFLAG